jgi:hypothetical protein
MAHMRIASLSPTDLILSREPFQFGRSANVAAKPDRWTHVAEAVQNNRMLIKWIVPKIHLTFWNVPLILSRTFQNRATVKKGSVRAYIDLPLCWSLVRAQLGLLTCA